MDIIVAKKFGLHSSIMIKVLFLLGLSAFFVYLTIDMIYLSQKYKARLEHEAYLQRQERIDAISVDPSFRSGIDFDDFLKLSPEQEKLVELARLSELKKLEEEYWFEVHNCPTYSNGAPNYREAGLTVRKREDKVREIFIRVATETGFSVAKLLAIGRQESMFCTNFISSKGAFGMMQFMPPTGRAYGVTDPRDIYVSVLGAARYLLDEMRWYENPANLVAYCRVHSCANVKWVRNHIREGGMYRLLVKTYHGGRKNVMNGMNIGPENIGYVKYVMRYYEEYRKKEGA